MKYDPEKSFGCAWGRRSIRLPGYDYTQPSGYFITLVTVGKMNLFGEIHNGEMILNELGEIAMEEWFKTAKLRPYVRLDAEEFQIMPDHLHGIIEIVDTDSVVGARRRRAPTTLTSTPALTSTPTDGQAPTTEQFGKPVIASIPTIVRAYKSAVTYRINTLYDTRGAPVWQRNYYERVIRNEAERDRIRRYIQANPSRWEADDENLGAE